ncbi:MAG: type II secretion system protein, partial [Dokdonella sp.]
MNSRAASGLRRRFAVDGRGLPANRAKGFTLIEMIAAFVIFALAMASLMQILTMSLNGTRRSLDETRAALWAQSLLDKVGIGERI